jgi:hypothetical protein
MWGFALVLVIGFFVVHDTENWIAAHSRFNAGDAHYMLQGLGGTILASCLFIFIKASKPSFWRTITLPVLIFWIIEQVEVVACRMMVGEITREVANTGMCTYATGIPFGQALMWIEALVIVVAIPIGIRAYLRGDYEN